MSLEKRLAAPAALITDLYHCGVCALDTVRVFLKVLHPEGHSTPEDPAVCDIKVLYTLKKRFIVSSNTCKFVFHILTLIGFNFFGQLFLKSYSIAHDTTMQSG